MYMIMSNYTLDNKKYKTSQIVAVSLIVCTHGEASGDWLIVSLQY